MLKNKETSDIYLLELNIRNTSPADVDVPSFTLVGAESVCLPYS